MSSASIHRNGDPLFGARSPRAAPFNSKHHSPARLPLLSRSNPCFPLKSSSNSEFHPKRATSYQPPGDPASPLLALDRSAQTLDAFLFNSLIQFYISKSRFLSALEIYPEMISRGVPPNRYTFPILFKACSLSLELSYGVQLHAHSIKFSFSANLFVAVALMDMYMKNGEVSSAQKVFDRMAERDVVAWNVLVTGYAQNGKPEEALLVYSRMRSCGLVVGQLAIASILAACSQLHLLHQGKLVHSWIVKAGFDADTVIATAVLELYGNCNDIKSAMQLFDEMAQKDLIAWNCLLSTCAQNGLLEDAISLLLEMQTSGLKPNGSSLAGILPVFAHSGMLNAGRSCHGFMIRNNLRQDEFALTSLLDLYAKCGALPAARKLFDAMADRDSVVPWSALIAGYGIHGQGAIALALFEEMLARNVSPNHVTYIGVLLACSHSGLVAEGRAHFDRMVRGHGIAPRTQHFACMVDLLARAGQFDDATELIGSMPVEPTAGVWGALLSGCRVRGNVELAAHAAARLFDLRCSDAGFYVLLSNTYASAGMWGEAGEVRSLMRERGVRKAAGWSSIEIGREVRVFLSGDLSHADGDQMRGMVDGLMKQSDLDEFELLWDFG